MIQSLTMKTAVLVVTSLLTIQAFAQKSTPAEKATAQIKRNANSPNPMVGQLSKNLFKIESYQDNYVEKVPYQATENYTVEIPYEDTETYSVEVPYQTTETYTENVPYQDTETYTENVPYQVQVPYTDYETDYRQEYQCHNVTRYRQECRNEQQCYIIPGSGGQQCHDVQECGVNAIGQQICKTRQVCDAPGEPQQRCENKQICNNVPYNEQECAYVQVPYRREVTRYRTETQYRQETRTRTVTRYKSETRTRTVTKYRTETRTRTVTKTRTETRTRTVTKYRDEVKCCVTKTREVFDKQLQYNVSVVFPSNALLQGADSETLNIKLISATQDSAQVEIQVVDSIYGYRIANQTTSGASILVELALAPKYNLSNAGADTIQNLRVDYVAALQKFQVSFSDKLAATKIQSVYSLEIIDIATGQNLETLEVKSLTKEVLGAVLNTALDAQAKIKVVLKVQRSGALIQDGQISFETSATVSEKRSLSKETLASLSDKKLLTISFSGKGLSTAVTLNDLTAEFSDVSTSYDIYIDVKTSSGPKAINMKTFKREDIKQKNMTVAITDVIGKSTTAQNALKAGQTLIYTIVAKRTGTSSLIKGKTIKVEKNGESVVK